MALSYRIPIELSLQSKDIQLLDNASLFDHLAPLPTSQTALGLTLHSPAFEINPTNKKNGQKYRSIVPDLVGMMALPCATDDDFVLYPSSSAESDSRCMSHFSDDFVEEARVLINQLADAPINTSPFDPSHDTFPDLVAEAFDSTLDSPLGLSALHFPFDYSPLNEYLISPLFTARANTEELSELSSTPDLTQSSYDLFAPSPTPDALIESKEEAIVEEVEEDAMDEEYTAEEVKEEEEEVVEERTTRSSARKNKSSFVLELGARSATGKRLFNGTRSTAFEIVPLDAPIQKRNFSTPSRTSRKRLPKAVERILPPTKRQRLKSVKVEEEIDGDFKVEVEESELPKEVEDLVERKRKENTLAARVSRQRKKENLDALVAENVSLKEENSELSKENQRLRKQLGLK